MRRTAFTLIELMICIACITILAGVMGRLWIGFERIAVYANQNYDDAIHAQILFEQIRNDAFQAIQILPTDDDMLALQQVGDDDAGITIRYRIEDNRLVRTVVDPEGNESAMNLVSLDDVTFSVTPDGTDRVRLQWQKEATGRAGEMPFLNRQMVVTVGGWTR